MLIVLLCAYAAMIFDPALQSAVQERPPRLPEGDLEGRKLAKRRRASGEREGLTLRLIINNDDLVRSGDVTSVCSGVHWVYPHVCVCCDVRAYSRSIFEFKPLCEARRSVDSPPCT